VQGQNHRCHQVLSLHALRPGDGQRSAGAPSGAETGRCIRPQPCRLPMQGMACSADGLTDAVASRSVGGLPPG
jgi:hypothetical protein